MKFTKFEIAKKAINDIVEEYKEAKENNDEELMEQLQEEYIGFRSLLWSSYNYAKSINAADLYLETQKDDIDEYKKTQNEIVLGQRTLYLSNRVFVNNVAKSDNIESFMKKDDKKATNFVKKHFGKFALGAAAAVTAMALGLTGCFGGNKNKEQSNTQTSTETTVSNTTTPKTTEKETKTTENVVVATDNGYVKLNELPEFADNNIYTETADENNGNNKNVDKNANKDGVEFKFNNKQFEKKVVTEKLDPHVTNDDSGKKTTVTVKPETPATEKDPVDYDTKTKDNTKKNKKEKTTIIEKEEKKNVETENLPIEGATEKDPVDYKPEHKDEDFISSEEKVTIIEIDETQEVNKDIKVEDNASTNKDKQETIVEEKVVYEEKEETVEVNTENLPIVEGKAKTLAYRM